MKRSRKVFSHRSAKENRRAGCTDPLSHHQRLGIRTGRGHWISRRSLCRAHTFEKATNIFGQRPTGTSCGFPPAPDPKFGPARVKDDDVRGIRRKL